MLQYKPPPCLLVPEADLSVQRDRVGGKKLNTIGLEMKFRRPNNLFLIPLQGMDTTKVRQANTEAQQPQAI